MIYKRVVAKLRAQDWMAIAIELAIVIVGVFIGTQVSNWNAKRLDRAKTEQMARDLKPELRNLSQSFDSLINYYAVTRRYGETAFAGWRGDPKVSDNDFVIAAYQASQITYTGVNNDMWSQIFGADRLRDLKDRQLRDNLTILMTTDFAAIERDLGTDYRRDVRRFIPEDVQDAIRNQCGDRRRGLYTFSLPARCGLKLPVERARASAQALRQNPELVGELRLHFAVIATYVSFMEDERAVVRRVIERIGQA